MIFDTLENIKNYEGLGRVYTALKFLADTDFSKIDLKSPLFVFHYFVINSLTVVFVVVGKKFINSFTVHIL